MYDTIIFDVDGTLIDTEKAVIGSLQRMLSTEYGMDKEASELSFVLGIPGALSLPQLGIERISPAVDRWNELMKDFYDTISVFDGIEEVMASLHNRNFVQGIVTSKTREELEEDFVPFGLSTYLSFTVCADDTLRHKPDPEPLLKFIDISGSDPKRSIYIGDTVYDYECARDAGIDFGLALWGCKHPERIPARHIFAHPQDILRYCDNGNLGK
ncbi:HAD family hydrolase [Paenibacillus macerans]|uniref:HAD family hydrolase n=1 Tax=Paenibacillus macerans TaxID=44252 RepID=UPI003D3127DA